MAQGNIQTRLCPHCANSIGADALICPYCKAALPADGAPQWAERPAAEVSHYAAEKQKLPVKSKAILALGLLVFALGIYMVGGNVERHDLDEVLARQQKILEEKEKQIQTLEAELAVLQHKHQGSNREVAGIRARLEESQKKLAATERKLASAHKEIDKLTLTRSAAGRPAARPVESAAGQGSAQPSAVPRTYEAVRATPVHEAPASSARVVAELSKGTQVTVVGSESGWLEIRSRHGKPPGFIRADDAIFVSRAN